MADQTVSSADSRLVFNNTYTANCTQQYIKCIVAAEKDFESHWGNSVTLNMTFDEQAQDVGNDAASNTWPYWIVESYSSLQAALPASDDLPTTDPTGGRTWDIPEAYARMLGLSTQAPATDDTVTLNTSYSWDYGQDVTDTIEHEISEGALGRVGGLGDQNGVWSTMDLFRYSSAGARDLTDGRGGKPTYFSANGASLSAEAFNNQFNGSIHANTGDTADFVENDVFGTAAIGSSITMSPTDISMMTALGWKATSPVTPPQADNFLIHDNNTGQSTGEVGTPYAGPDQGLKWQFVDLNTDNLDIAGVTPNSFIYSGTGDDAINVSSAGGDNTLDASGGSNFLVGGAGDDTFLLNDLYSTTPIWTTLVNFHAGDAATVYGVTRADFSISWAAGQGANGYTGLTAHISGPGKPVEYLTLAGLSPADLSNGHLAVQFGVVNNTPYMEISHL